MPSPIAFIIGAGSNVGKSVGEMLLKNGYKVALGSRRLDQNADKDGFFPVTVDVTKPETIASAFKTVEEKLGAPASVVVYNGTMATEEYCAQSLTRAHSHSGRFLATPDTRRSALDFDIRF